MIWGCRRSISSGGIRDGAWVAELTGLVHLSGWPAGMRLIVRKEHPHPGAQLPLTDRNGLQLTAFVTNTFVGSLQTLELRHRRRARCEDRIRTGEGHRSDELTFAWFRAESDLVGDCRARVRADSVDADAGVDQ